MKTSITSNLTIKVGGSMVVIVILAVGLATLLNLLRFQETYERLVGQRLEVAVQEIGRAIIVGASLGLRIESQGNLPDLLRHHAAANPDLATVIVYDCKERPVADHGWKAAFGEPWRAHQGENRWRVFNRDSLLVGLTIRNGLGACIAGVAARKPSQAYVAVLDKVTHSFLAIGAVAAVLAVFSVLAAAFYFDDRRRSLHKLDKDLAGVLAGTAPASPPKISMATFGNRWERTMVERYLEARPELRSRATEPRAPCDEAKSP